MTQKNRSNCCKAEITAIGSDEGTYYYRCDKCLKPCDPMVEQPESGQEACGCVCHELDTHNCMICFCRKPVKQRVYTTLDSNKVKDDSKQECDCRMCEHDRLPIQPSTQGKQSGRSFFDMPEAEKREIVEKAAKESNRMQKELMDKSDLDGSINGVKIELNKSYYDLTSWQVDEIAKYVSKLVRATTISTRQQERERILREVIGEDEDIMEVHDFFKPRQKITKALKAGEIVNSDDSAYVYAGGQLNGRNQLRAEQREKLEQIK